jgi:hypothetical protein
MKYGLFCWFGCIGLAYAQSANPIKITITDASHGGTKVVIENDSTSVLTAIAFSSPAEPMPHLMDSAIQQWREVAPGKSSNMDFGTARPSPGLEFNAAILADGRTFGDAATVQAFLAKRRATLQGLGIILQHLPTAGTTQPGPVIPLFRTYKAEQLKGLQNNDPVQIAIINANMWMERKMQMMTGELPDSIITEITAMLSDWQAALARSVPSLSAVR